MPCYAETYLPDAMENLGEMAHFATLLPQVGLETLWQGFIVSGYARLFGEGSPQVVAGMSGADLALRVCDASGISLADGEVRQVLDDTSLCAGLSAEYWCGWSLAYYQWTSGRTFADIWNAVPTAAVLRMYPTFHEQSEDRFAEAMEDLVARARTATRLQVQRKRAGLSQSQLARLSGVGLRAIQQYEQRAKDVNRASAASVMALARALFCNPEDILEPAPRFEYAVVGLE